MLIQQILIALIAIGAAAYLIRALVRSFRSDKGCEGACKCSPVDKAEVQ